MKNKLDYFKFYPQLKDSPYAPLSKAKKKSSATSVSEGSENDQVRIEGKGSELIYMIDADPRTVNYPEQVAAMLVNTTFSLSISLCLR